MKNTTTYPNMDNNNVQVAAALSTQVLPDSEMVTKSFQNEKINVRVLLKKIISQLSLRLDSYIELNGIFPKIYLEEEKLEQIFLSLLTNAIKFNHKKKCLVGITGWQDDDFFYFDVADNGMGIAKKDLNNIFSGEAVMQENDRFGKKGAGGSLVVVKQILEDLGGSITVRSKKGTGSLFQVAIPCKYNL